MLLQTGLRQNCIGRRALRTWLRAKPDADHDGLLVTKSGKPLGVRAIQHLVKKYLKEAGINGASVHTLRHTFGPRHVAPGDISEDRSGDAGARGSEDETSRSSCRLPWRYLGRDCRTTRCESA